MLPFYPFTGSGNLRILRDNDFNSVDVAKSYFGELRNILTDELLNTPPSQMLFVFVLSPDRLFRSINYDKDKDTWDFCPEDFMLFGQWLQSCFPTDHKRIVFVDVSNGKTSEECRSWQIQLGQAWADNKGGRPRKRKQYKKDYYHVAVSLAAVEKMNATQIRNFLRENHGVDITDRAVRKWLQAGNVAAKRGRPTGIKNGTFHHVDSFTIPSSPHISSVWREVEGMNGLVETLCTSTTTTHINNT